MSGIPPSVPIGLLSEGPVYHQRLLQGVISCGSSTGQGAGVGTLGKSQPGSHVFHASALSPPGRPLSSGLLGGILKPSCRGASASWSGAAGVKRASAGRTPAQAGIPGSAFPHLTGQLPEGEMSGPSLLPSESCARTIHNLRSVPCSFGASPSSSGVFADSAVRMGRTVDFNDLYNGFINKKY